VLDVKLPQGPVVVGNSFAIPFELKNIGVLPAKDVELPEP
jgi:hypothetical protein